MQTIRQITESRGKAFYSISNLLKACAVTICLVTASPCYAKPAAKKPPVSIFGTWTGTIVLKQTASTFLQPTVETTAERQITVKIVKTGRTARFNFVTANPASYTELSLKGIRKGFHQGETVTDCIYSSSIYVEALNRKKLYFSTSTSAEECESLTNTYLSGAATLTKVK